MTKGNPSSGVKKQRKLKQGQKPRSGVAATAVEQQERTRVQGFGGMTALGRRVGVNSSKTSCRDMCATDFTCVYALVFPLPFLPSFFFFVFVFVFFVAHFVYFFFSSLRYSCPSYLFISPVGLHRVPSYFPGLIWVLL